jgi:ATP-dependent protease ClpP protease subunit
MSKASRLRTQRRMQALRVSADQAQQIAEGRTWYRMVTDLVDLPDTAAIYLYEEIGYWGVEAQDFVRDLMALRVANIILHINSPGGDVFDGLAIYHALRDHPATIEARVDGLAASAASFIAMAGDTVVMQRNASMMIHDASTICYGNAEEFAKVVEFLDKQSNNIADIYVQQAGGTVEQWRAAMKAETWYTADEALAAGLCDEVNNADEETEEETAVVPGDAAAELDELMAKSYDLTVFAYHYAGREKAPAPKALDELAGEQPAEPAVPVEPAAVEVAAESTPEHPAEVVTPAATEDAPEAPAVEPDTDPAESAPAAPTDEWADLFRPLTEATPSGLDEVFAALWK